MESRRALSIVAAILAWITALPVALWVLFFGLRVRCDEACTGDGWQRSASGWQWHAVAASGAFLFLSATVLVVSVFRRRRWLAVLSVLTQDAFRDWLAAAGEDARRAYDHEDTEAHWGWEWRTRP